jgi:hypothetical protein
MKNWILYPLLALTLGACASGATSVKMTVPADQSTPRAPEALRGAIWIESVGGGKETNPAWTSQVDNRSFEAALTESLRNFGYLASDRPAARREVIATIRDVEQPVFGFDLTVQTTVLYELRHIPAGAAESHEIVATGRATLGDAFLGVERLRMANERSVQDNIRKFLAWLATAQ